MMLDLLATLGIAILFYVIYVVLFHRPAQEVSQVIIPSNTYSWPDLEHFDTEIVGESNYQSAIQKIAGIHGDDGPKVICTAHLIPEDYNPHDNKAVRVAISGSTVGYLSRDDARSFRRRLGAKKLTGQVTSCKATLSGGFAMKDGTKASYGVMLDIKPFDN